MVSVVSNKDQRLTQCPSDDYPWPPLFQSEVKPLHSCNPNPEVNNCQILTSLTSVLWLSHCDSIHLLDIPHEYVSKVLKLNVFKTYAHCITPKVRCILSVKPTKFFFSSGSFLLLLVVTEFSLNFSLSSVTALSSRNLCNGANVQNLSCPKW